ncbi:hypothetical protein L3Q82_017209 [Scortum barcoo]|uniref:Uncharacterized protein n=1 Tax=Scortum barcoo TaxID=214431 RepID=A0ACB8VL75_9TELE|nr:hypothetical protein L3Q82_017209 [Scortum barcoo]
MERYIKESLAADIIHLSKSPLGAGFFFLSSSRRRTLLCVPASISKRGQIQSDLKTNKAVNEWPILITYKLLQRFLGFANFYHLFICNCSQVVSLLTTLTSPFHPFYWTPKVDKSFCQLKRLFTTALVLTQPDPTVHFVVSADVGVGTILSQKQGPKSLLHPCAFFSHHLSSAEANYDMGNRELLGVKLVLEEWQHWLEDTALPFVVWANHKNLAYIQNVKRLHCCQARWALFFS